MCCCVHTTIIRKKANIKKSKNYKTQNDMGKKVGLIFPGQGSQFVGMGKNLYDNFVVAKEVFHEVDDALNEKLSSVMFDGSMEQITITSNAQPAIMAVSMAALRVLCNELGYEVNDMCCIVAGHSLGEYSALCASGAFNLSTTTRLLRVRGGAMEKAMPQGLGGMVALLGVDSIHTAYELAAAAQKFGEDSGRNGCLCQVANDNGCGQVVLSGTIAEIDTVTILARQFGVKRAIKLQVSGPFHCALMRSAADDILKALDSIEVQPLRIPIVPNCTASVVCDSSCVKKLLVDQVVSVVQWRKTMDVLAKEGVKVVVEVGPGQVLSKIAGRHFDDKEIKVINFGLNTELDSCLDCISACT